MFNPSGTTLQPGDEFQIKTVEKGLYTVTNAYGGLYEYFEGRPINAEDRDARLARLSEIAAKHRPKRPKRNR